MKQKKLFQKPEVKIFLTAWIVFIFYLQMFGSSCMANSQSALTAAIVNEGRFEVDTYHRVSCDLAFYDNHYYSGISPGVSFISTPLYLISKPFFFLIPNSLIEFTFDKLESHGATLPEDYWGNQKVLSNYFVDLDKRSILEFIFISGFILPIFTTALISALSSVLFYMIVSRITKNERLRLISTLLYSFGTMHFLLSTIYLQRPIAITLAMLTFFILFKIKHGEIQPKGQTYFFAGLIIGLATWFDYFHIVIAAMLAGYLWLFFDKKGTFFGRIFNFKKEKIVAILKFAAGFIIPILLLFSYYWIIFDDPLANSYSHRTVEASNHAISDLFQLNIPTQSTYLNLLNFFINSPVIFIAILGMILAYNRKKFRSDVLSIGLFGLLVFIYGAMLALAYPTSVASEFSRHMTPIIPFFLLFLPYAFETKKKSLYWVVVSISIISLLINWAHVQYAETGNFDAANNDFSIISQLLTYGPSAPVISTFASVLGLPGMLLNIVALIILLLILRFLWKK